MGFDSHSKFAVIPTIRRPDAERLKESRSCFFLLWRHLAQAPLCVLVLLTGCTGWPTESERAARRDLQTITTAFRPRLGERRLPALPPDAALGDYLRFAMLNQPRVEAAYFDWAASVERITVER